ncbi:MAG: hypothetical protein M1113_02585 [Candidatus Thermoplasmatota archaeon]|nr:hypothetical protein [Candidatus Thermoplasmatota archaeon]
MTQKKIVLYPFDEEYTETLTVGEFREWVYDHFEIFRHDLTTALSGDILIFCFKEEPGKWLMVGEATVDFNHQIDEPASYCDMCSDKSEEYDADFLRHISTTNYKQYRRNINAKEITGNKPGRLAIINGDQYQELHETLLKPS